MRRLELRLLGGFEARLGDRIITGFESQKARALLAYVALHREQLIPRERLSGLFWSERSEESARRNLRQALHSVRSAFATGDDALPIFESKRHSVRINPELDTWVDAAVFEDTVRGDLSQTGPDPHHLATAARLYSGDLLAGFFVKDCPLFEEWLITEQERLREEAIEAFRSLIAAYLSRGEHRYGIQYARRLLAIDPLSEEAQRQLMLLYAQAGRRNRALAQYEQLRNLLNSELGVEPLAETTELYRSLLLEELPPEAEGSDEPIGPLIPLVGRGRALTRLQESWASVLEGKGRLTLVEGETGVGKSRLVKSLIDGVTSKRRTIVLSARCFPSAPQISYQPFSELLAGAFSDLLPDEPEIQGWLTDALIADLALISPPLCEIVPELFDRPVEMSLASSERLADSFFELLTTLVGEGGNGKATPVILLIDDLQWADGPSRDLFRKLAGRIGELPIWCLATCRPDLKEIYPLPDDRAGASAEVERLPIMRLEEEAVRDLSRALVGLSSAPLLEAFLWKWSLGLPLTIAELVNFLWDEKVLIPERPGQWQLRGDPAELVSPPESLTQLIHLRVQRLPTSARRLLAVAAVIGQQFDAELLGRAADEHLAVVETCVELLLERWLIRQFPRSWSRAKPQQDIVLWARGARRGSFEFSHKAVRDSMLENINPLRKSIMHRDLARTLRNSHADNLPAISERLSFHELACGEWAEVLPCLEISAAKARRCGADEIAEWYLERSTKVIERLLKSVGDEEERERLSKKREEILQLQGERVSG